MINFRNINPSNYSKTSQPGFSGLRGNKKLNEMGLGLDQMLKKPVKIGEHTKCSHSGGELLTRRHEMMADNFQKAETAGDKLSVAGKYIKNEAKEAARVIKSNWPRKGPPGGTTPTA